MPDKQPPAAEPDPALDQPADAPAQPPTTENAAEAGAESPVWTSVDREVIARRAHANYRTRLH